jgi:hypothetical protein
VTCVFVPGVSLRWTVAVLPGHRPGFIVLAAVFSVLVLVQLVYGAVDAERARRYGCR